MTHSYTQTLSVTYAQSISMSSSYESSKVFIRIEFPDGQFLITENQIYEYTQIPIYSYTIIPTEYSYEIVIDTRPTQKNISLITILSIVWDLLFGLLIILIIFFLF